MPTEWVEEWVATKNEFLDNPARNVMGFKITGPGAARLLELRKQMVKSLHDGEAKLLVGTDALQLFMIPGFSVRAEMALMAESGLSPYEILAAATRRQGSPTVKPASRIRTAFSRQLQALVIAPVIQLFVGSRSPQRCPWRCQQGNKRGHSTGTQSRGQARRVEYRVRDRSMVPDRVG